MNKIYIYGKHPVAEALSYRPDVVEKVFLDPLQYPELDSRAKNKGIFRERFDEQKISKRIGDEAVHQHVAALVNLDELMTDLPSLEETLAQEKGVGLVLLGEVQDPQNVGSIIRSAAAFGMHGVLIPKDRQAQITSSVIKASVGTAFRIPLIAIGNVNQTVRELKDKRFWVYGLAGDGARTIRDEDFTGNSVFIVGNEAQGIRAKTSEHCDAVLRIPISENAESLNAGTSAAIAFYEWRSKQ
ncbi:MAG: 23S rRNA (guanosine(2251)-2'-O)-methyltransferase RlmB [Patescibacteria group bacterium UBA2163]